MRQRKRGSDTNGKEKGRDKGRLAGEGCENERRTAGRLSNTVYLHSSPRLLCVCVRLCVLPKLADERKTVFKMG